MNQTAVSRDIAAINGMRAVAVLLILIFHVNEEWMPGGFVGVDIFFVISGFVVTLSVGNFSGRLFFDYVKWFYRRRILRIIPALIVLLIPNLVIWTLLLPDSARVLDVPLTGVGSIFGGANIYLYISSNDYFGLSADYNLFTHTWSLGVEEQFYLLFPLISYFLIVNPMRVTSHRGLVKGVFLVLMIGSLWVCYLATLSDRSFAFYLMPARFWELALGVFLAQWAIEDGDMNGGGGSGIFLKFIELLTPLAAIALVISAIFTKIESFPFPGAILPCVATGVLLVAAHRGGKSWILRPLSAPLIVWIGKLSYSLYLWHWPVVVLLRWSFGLDNWWTRAIAIGGSFLLACASYYLIERPMRYSKSLLQLRGTAFSALVTIGIVLPSFVAAASLWLKPTLSLSATADTNTWRGDSVPAAGTNGCASSRLQSTLGGGGRHYTITAKNCTPRESRVIYVIGDSHAAAYQRNFHRLASEESVRTEIYFAPGCRPIGLDQGTAPAMCKRFFVEAASEVMQAAREGDVLFLPGLYISRIRDGLSPILVENEDLDLAVNLTDQVVAAQRFEYLKPFIDKGLRVVVEAPKPVLRVSLFRCADPVTRLHPDCELDQPQRNTLLERRARALMFLQAVKSRSPAIVLWDPFLKLCPTEVCDGYVDHRPVMFDADHLSGYGNDVLYSSLRAVLTGSQ